MTTPRSRFLTICSLPFLAVGCNSSSDSDVTPSGVTEQEQKAALTSDMAKLDTPYVTALFYSNMSPGPALFADAKTTLGTLENQWTAFRQTHENAYDSQVWTNGFPLVDQDLSTASTHYTTIDQFPANLTPAHLALEDVREVLGNMRADVGIDDYVMDLVTDVHHKMEPVSKAYGAYAATSDLTALKTTLANDLPVFAAALQKLAAAYGSGEGTASLYGLTAPKASRLTKNINNTDPAAPGLLQIVNKLSQALADNDDALVPTLASKIKGKFVSIFLGFGDFVTPFESDVIAFQRSIIPLLYCTGNPPDAATICAGASGDIREGALANAQAANAAWAAFKSHYPQNDSINVPGLLGWTTSINTIDAKLASLSSILGNASDITEAKKDGAHFDAEDIRDEYYNLIATFEGTSTLMTRMDEYHATFEKIVPKAMDDILTADEIATIKTQLPALQSAFDALSTALDNADKAAWGLEQTDTTTLLSPQAQNIAALSSAVDNYDAASNDNSEQIIGLTKAVKGLYRPFFRTLGAFANNNQGA